jgi:3-oxoacyl-[acyl-carrier-protein] synthase II
MKKRVVITGLGVVSPVGLSVKDFWDGLISGKNGVDYITYFDTTNFKTKFAAELKGFDPLNYLERKLSQSIDPFTRYALIASAEAVKDSGLDKDMDKLDNRRCGVIYGSGIGGMWTYQEEQYKLFKTRQTVEGKPVDDPGRISPFFIPKLIADIAAGRISMVYGFKGPNYATVSACATSAHSIADAFMLIQRGTADVMIAGGAEAVICPMGIGGFNAMKALSTRNDDPGKASRPFDKNRDGFVMGEGGASLILEEYEHAKKRGAKIYAELAGIGLTGDAYHITEPAPEGEGLVGAMTTALADANMKPEDIDVVNAHGTSTYYNDKNESTAVKTVFGERAYKMPVHSIKSMIGHLLGAAGAIEAIASVLTIVNGEVPPTINYEEKDPECDLFYVPNTSIKQDVRAVISNNLGFGGHNTALIFKKFEA